MFRLVPLACALLLLLAPSASAQTGGVNTGLPGSTCEADVGGWTYTVPPTDVEVNGPGDSAPAYHEVAPPASGDPKGVMLVIHGGGWYTVGKEAVVAMRGIADRWRGRGFETVNLTYGACGASIGDVVAFYDLVRARWPSLPVCATGSSAGAHLAMTLATMRPDVACVAALAGPTNLVDIATQPANGSLTGPTSTYGWAAAAFGVGGLVSVSPLLQAPLVSARVLQVAATNDPSVPVRQATDLDALLAGYSDVAVLDPGTVQFVHSKVSGISKDWMFRREINLVAPITGDPPAECDLCGAGAGWSRVAAKPAPAGSVAQITMSNDVAVNGVKAGTLTAVEKLTAVGGSLTIPATSVSVPAGRIKLQTCWAAGGAVTVSNCAEREVTTTTATTQQTVAKSLGFARLVTPYWWSARVNVLKFVNNAWKTIGTSWRGDHGSRLTVPTLTTTTY